MGVDLIAKRHQFAVLFKNFQMIKLLPRQYVVPVALRQIVQELVDTERDLAEFVPAGVRQAVVQIPAADAGELFVYTPHGICNPAVDI